MKGDGIAEVLLLKKKYHTHDMYSTFLNKKSHVKNYCLLTTDTGIFGS